MKRLFSHFTQGAVPAAAISLLLTAAVPAQADGIPSSPATTLAAVGPHSRKWNLSTANQVGDDTVTNTIPVVEMATGLNYWDGQQWQPSDTSFQLAQGGTIAVVNKTQHK